MRTHGFGIGLCLIAIVGCGGGGMTGDDVVGDDMPPGDDEPPPSGFQLRSPDITLAPGEETTKCWYFQTPNTADLGVKRWASSMTPGSHHMIVYFSDGLQEEPGSIVENCGITGGSGLGAVWTYSAQDPEADQQLPDGVGMLVEAGQYGFIQMHYLNATEAAMDVHVTLDVETYEEGAQYTRAAPYITFHNAISIPPMSERTFGGSCEVPAGKQFYQLGTHAHKQATHMRVMNGTEIVFESDDWSHPGGREWVTAPHYEFTSGRIDYSCDFYNPSEDRTITTGDSAQFDEMCMAVGYMFPATGPQLCVNLGANPGSEYYLPPL